MTGLVIFGVTILLLVLALEPAHRRVRGAPRAGQTRTGQPDDDRDQQRLLTDLRDRYPHREAVQRRHVTLPHLGRHSTVGAHGHRA
jgi:hypothetical protein